MTGVAPTGPRNAAAEDTSEVSVLSWAEGVVEISDRKDDGLVEIARASLAALKDA